MQKRVVICVVDGQGGGIGSVIVKRIKEEFGERVEIIALGTNAIATAAMMKMGANKGATGENAIVWLANQADYIIGPIGIIIANAMMGELTPKMAEAISSSPAQKILLPLTQEKVTVVGVIPKPLPHQVDELILKHLKERIDV